MAINTTLRTALVPLQADDIRYPIAKWVAWHQIVGDVTGGIIDTVFDWSVAPTEQVFSLEEVSFWNNGATADMIGRYLIVFRENVLEGQNWFLSDSLLMRRLAADTTASARASFPNGYIWRPTGPNAWRLEMVMDNINLAAGRFAAWGYAWDMRALSALGGPLRPGTTPIYTP